MLSFVVLILAMMYSFHARQQEAAPPPVEMADLPRPAAGGPSLPPPASGVEFEGLFDKTKMTPRDNPAYLKLLQWVREKTPAELARAAHRGIFFSQLIDNPTRYRGLPIHIEGTVRRTMRQETPGSKLFEQGAYIESYATTPDSGKYPWVLVFEDAPPDFPIGGDLKEPVSFDGYFLKLLAYEAGDTYRFAPLLVGRMHWQGTPAVPRPAATRWPVPPWVAAALGLLLVLMLVRWTVYARGFFQPAVARPSASPVIRDEIEPEQLSAWIESQEEPEPEDDWNSESDEKWR